MKKAIIIGASSGIGEALAQKLSQEGYIVGLTARRYQRLKQIQKTLPNPSYIKQMDITEKGADQALIDFIHQMQDVDLVIINAGIGFSTSHKDWDQKTLFWEKERLTTETNVCGFVAMAMASYHYFIKKQSGHIVGVSSIAGLMANPMTPAYSASKIFMSNYLNGLRFHAIQKKLPITVTEIQPGYVDTKLAQGALFWVASPEKAAKQIFHAIKRRKDHAYVTKRWKIIAWLFKILPDFLHKAVHKICCR